MQCSVVKAHHGTQKTGRIGIGGTVARTGNASFDPARRTKKREVLDEHLPEVTFETKF